MTNSVLWWIYTKTPLLYLYQSLWRDEAFSIIVAENSLTNIVQITTNDYNPPLYYFLLKIWMIIFGKSEISVRSLSFLFLILLGICVYKLFSKTMPALWGLMGLILIIINPLLLYYAFEARMYTLFALLSFLSTQALYEKHWYRYIIFTVLGLYTHSFMVLTVISQIIYVFLAGKKINKTHYLPALLAIFLAYLPWLFILYSQFTKTTETWISPLDNSRILSLPAYIVLGYEGYPDYIKPVMLKFSLIMLLITAITMKRKSNISLIFLLWMIIPLLISFVISMHIPMIVNRFLITTAVSFCIILVIFIHSIKQITSRLLLISSFIIFFVKMNLILIPYKQKPNLRSVFQTINLVNQTSQYLIVTDPLVYFEARYYLSQRNLLYVYNKSQIPRYIGKAAIDSEKIINSLPQPPFWFIDRNGKIKAVHKI